MYLKRHQNEEKERANAMMMSNGQVELDMAVMMSGNAMK